MYDEGQKVLAYLDAIEDWVPAIIQCQVKGWDCDFQRQYKVVLDTPYWDGDEHAVTMTFSARALKTDRQTVNQNEADTKNRIWCDYHRLNA